MSELTQEEFIFQNMLDGRTSTDIAFQHQKTEDFGSLNMRREVGLNSTDRENI